LSKGHTLEELVNLKTSERLFFQAAWEVELEYIEKILGEVNTNG
jgi:hypothetical protein